MPLERLQKLQDQLGTHADRTTAALERFTAQADYAAGLCELHPGKANTWSKLIEQAWQAVESAAEQGPAELEQAALAAEDTLAPLAQTAKSYTIHCIGHAHIDMNWQWGWPETVLATLDTFQTVLGLMDEFPSFTFSQSQASVYDIVRRHDPEMFARIADRVKQGRWEVTAATWVEGDKNLAGGEALARHFLYTRAFFAEQLGLSAEQLPLDWAPDTFGHANTLPTLAAAGGVRHLYFCRGGSFDKPPVFWWVGPDGSRILANRETTWYNDHLSPHVVPPMVAFCKQTGLSDWMCVYGVGDHGGGPTRRDLKRALDMNEWPVFPTFQFSTAGAFYEILQAKSDWPEVDRDLNYEFPGCYTSQSRIKRTSRLGEALCRRAETAAVWAGRILGTPADTATLRDAWTRTLFGHFHDILPGSGVAATRDYHLGQFQETAALSAAVTRKALRGIAEQVDTTFAGPEWPDPSAGHAVRPALGGGPGWDSSDGQLSQPGTVSNWPRPFVVFNPTGQAVRRTVTCRVWDNGFWTARREVENLRFLARRPDGSALPAQQIAFSQTLGHLYVDLAVPVELPPLGYASLTIAPAGRKTPPVSSEYPTDPPIAELADHAPAVTCDRNAAQNEHVRVEFDSRTGAVAKLIDRKTGTDLARPDQPLAVLEYLLERAGGMSAWAVHPTRDAQCPLPATTFKRTQSGPHQARWETEISLPPSRAKVVYTLAAGEPFLRVDVEINWLHTGGADEGIPSLRLRLPTALADVSARYETPHGWVDRDEEPGTEVPTLRWTHLAGTVDGNPAGLAVINTGQSGQSLDGGTLSVRLIRSSYSPDPLPEAGEHKMSLALAPHGGKLTPAQVADLAECLDQPAVVVPATVHEGPLPASGGMVTKVQPDSVRLVAVKPAEDGEGTVCRLVNYGTRAATAKVSFDKDLAGSVASVQALDLLERPVEGVNVSQAGQTVSVAVAGRGIASVKVRFK